MMRLVLIFFFFFFNDTATTEIYTLSLHDALPISLYEEMRVHGFLDFISKVRRVPPSKRAERIDAAIEADRKSTRLNSSHLVISYAVFCLKKKTQQQSMPYLTLAS